MNNFPRWTTREDLPRKPTEFYVCEGSQGHLLRMLTCDAIATDLPDENDACLSDSNGVVAWIPFLA